MKEIWRKSLLAGGVVLAVAGGWLASRAMNHSGTHKLGQPVVQAATLLTEQKTVPDFQLQGAGGAFTQANLKGRWTILFFGYTHCPDVCPTALSLMRDVKSRLPASVSVPQVVFVSVDAARDSLELLGRYVPAFDPAFIGVTGDDAALAPLVKTFGVFYQRHEKEDPRNYTVDHSAAMYLINPAGKLQAVFMPPVPADRMASDYQAILMAAGK